LKIIFISTLYEQHLKNHYKKYPNNENLSYQIQLKKLLNDPLPNITYFAEPFNNIGEEAIPIISNAKPLQTVWAKENNIIIDDNWKFAIPIEQIKKYKPDILFIPSTLQYYGHFIKEIKSYTKTIIAYISCPMPDNTDYTGIDCILSIVPNLIDKYHKLGLASEQLHYAFSKKILSHIEENKKNIDISFIGGLIPSTHSKRIRYLNFIASNIPIKIWGYGLENRYYTYYQRIIRKFYPNAFISPIEKYYLGELWGIDMYNTLQHSKIVFNAHIDMAEEYVGSMRMYEVTGVGSLLLTENGRNIKELFEPDKEIITYSSEGELLEKIKYYLDNEQECKKIAQAGQKRTLKEYTFEKRAVQLHKIFKKYL